jgi:hypothetical protein
VTSNRETVRERREEKVTTMETEPLVVKRESSKPWTDDAVVKEARRRAVKKRVSGVGGRW